MAIKKILSIAIILTFSYYTQAQNDSISEEKKKGIEGLKYEQQPGLALAASKIFFSEKRWSISGFGEVNYVHYTGAQNRLSGDMELYYTNLYRTATFFGYRITPKIIWNSEFQLEFLHDGLRDYHYEIVVEAFMDFLIHKSFKARVGYFPLTIGYVNNNDEPVMFYSVNRSEVERIITPSTWIEFGTMFYGNISKKFSYAFAVAQGLTASEYKGSTWIRQGRTIRFGVPRSFSINPQLNYNVNKNLILSTSGYFGFSGQGEKVATGGRLLTVKAPVMLGTAYAKYDYKNFRFVTVGTFGALGETDLVYELTKNENGVGEVLGNKTFGYLAEVGCDLMHYIRKNKNIDDKKTWLYHKSEMKLPVFGRYERLNTHHEVMNTLQGLPRFQNNLHIVTLGINYNPRENIVLKANYQFRKNLFTSPLIPKESDLIEFGIGFIY